MGRDLIIEASGLRKTYRTGPLVVEALRGVDVAVARGEMVATMGPSGCGKTTLLNCLSGLDDFDDGAVRIAGVPLRDMSDNQKTAYRATHMGFIFQTYNLLPVLSAVENVELPLLVGGVRPREAHARAVEALETVGLGRWVKHRPAELSGGQRQRVTIARALVNKPAIVWADEPTGALDSEAARDILDLLGQLNEAMSQTVVMVTHAPEVGARAHRIVLMRDGAIADEGSGTAQRPAQITRTALGTR
jgi:putative ABC transport system ATP-binding protein